MSFSGGEYFELPSRKRVEREVDVFVHSTETAEASNCAFVLGEWGEGKTELYRGRIAPSLKGRACVAFLPATTLANSYDLPSVRELSETTPVEAERFLVALFAGLKADDENSKLGLPELSKSRSAKDYIEACLGSLSPRPHRTRVYVFIDEFEDLQNRPGSLVWIISGLKELINGNYAVLGKGGEFSGVLHFLVSCTPNVYLRLPKDISINQVSGGFFRRVRTITLPTPPRIELVRFIQHLLRWCWEGRLPDPPPFKSPGVHEAIAYVTRGNLGACVQLVSWLLSKAESSDITQIDGAFLVDALQDFRITVYGASSLCLEPKFFGELERAVRSPERPRRTPAELRLLSLLAGEHEPQSADRLREALPSLGSARDVRASIDEMNRRLSSQLGMIQPILALKPLRPDVDTSLLTELVLNATPEAGSDKVDFQGEIIQIEGYRESVHELEDRAVHFSFSGDGDLVPSLYLPSDPPSAMAFFEGISQKTASSMVHAFERHEPAHAEVCYGLSDQVKAQLFPSPVPPGLEFIVDQKVRLDTWRDAGRNLSQLTESLFPGILPSLIDEEGDWKCIGEQGSGKRSVILGNLKKEGTEIRVAFLGVISDPDKGDVADALETLRRPESPAHLALLLYSGEFSPQATQALEKSGLGPSGAFRVLPIQLNAFLIRRIVATGLCLQSRGSIAVDEAALREALKDLLGDELGLFPQLDKWLTFQTTAGLVVGALQDREGNLQRMIQALRYYVNFPRDKLDPQTAWDRNQKELMSLQFFGQKTPIAPDIQASQLDRISQDLLSNGFLSEDSGGYCAKLHPVEKRILEIAREHPGISVDRLRQQFVDRTGTKSIEVVFVEALVDKGLIAKGKGRTVSLVDSKEEARTLIQRFNSTSEGVRADKEAFDRYGVLLSVKERGPHWIDHSRWNRLLVDLSTDISRARPQFEWQDSSRVRLFGSLLETYETSVTPLIREAARAGKDELQKLRGSLAEARRIIRSALGEPLAAYFGVEGGAISELSAAEERIRSLEALDKSPAEDLDKKRLESSVGLEHFRFDSGDEQADFFNPKLSLLRQDGREVQKELDKIGQQIAEVGDRLARLRSDEAENHLRARSVNPPPSAICSARIRSMLITTLPAVPPKEPTGTGPRVFSMDDLLRRVAQYDDDRSSQVHNLRRAVESLRELAGLEPDARSKLEAFDSEWREFQRRITAGLTFGDAGAVDAELKSAHEAVGRLTEEADKLGDSPSLEKTRTFTDECVASFVSLRRGLERWRSAIRGIESAWQESVRDRVGNLRELLLLLPKGEPRNALDSRLRGVLQRVESQKQEVDPTLLKEIESLVTSLRTEIYSALSRALGGAAELPKVIETVVRFTEKGLPVSYDALLRQLQTTLAVDSKRAKDYLERIVQTGFLELLVRRRDS